MAKPDAELKKAIKKGDLASVRRLVAGGVPVNAELPGKVTPLEFALAEEKREIVWELLRLGAAPRQKKHENLLLDVPKFRDLELLRRLVELGADVHAPGRANLTPLLWAVACGFYDAAAWLLEQGADPRGRDDMGRSAFQLAAETRHFCTQVLPDAEGEAAELFRAQLADLERIERLLESRLQPSEVHRMRNAPEPEPEPSTFWDLNDAVEFRMEISPFPFTSQSTSRLRVGLGRFGAEWVDYFASEGQLSFRIRPAAGNVSEAAWTPLTFQGLDTTKKRARGGPTFLAFEGQATLPAGEAIVEIRVDTDWEMFSGPLPGWTIQVD